MSPQFDPYHKWLGIPAHEQPPNHYRLLGISLYEADHDVIEQAADRQMAHLRNHQNGPHAIHSQKLLSQVAKAKICLLNTTKKADYDLQLQHAARNAKREKLGPREIRVAKPLPAEATPVAEVETPSLPAFVINTGPKPAAEKSAKPAATATATETAANSATSAGTSAPGPVAGTSTRPKHLIVAAAGGGGLALLVLVAVAVMAFSGGEKETAQAPQDKSAEARKAAVHSGGTDDSATEADVRPMDGEAGSAADRASPKSASAAIEDSATPFLPVDISNLNLKPGADANSPTISIQPTSNGNASNPPAAEEKKPAPPREVPVNLDSTGQPTDLLPLINTPLDAVKGGWYRTGEAVVAPAESTALLQVPVRPPHQYQLAVTFSRQGGNGEIVLGLPIGSRAMAVSLFGRDGLASMQRVSNQPGGQTPAGKAKRSLGLGEEILCICNVGPQRLLVLLDGVAVIDWQGDPQAFTLPGNWKPRDAGQLWLGTSGVSVQFESLSLSSSPSFVVPEIKPVQVARIPAPAKADLTKEQLKIRAALKASLRTPTPETRIAVAEGLLDRLPSAEQQPIACYASLCEARELAEAAGHLDLALRAIDYLSQRFDEEPWLLKATSIAEVSRNAHPAALRSLASTACSLAQSAVQADRYDEADKLLAAADSAGLKLKDNDLRQKIRGRRADLKTCKSYYDATAAARSQLIADPTDARAQAAVGKFLCFIKGDWKAGLPHLAQSGDAELVRLAEMEGRRGSSAEHDVQLAAAWVQFAATSSADVKSRLQAHAAETYLAALPQLPAARQVEAVGQLHSLFENSPSLVPTVPKGGLQLWLAADAGVQHQNGLVFQWSDQSGRNHHAIQKDPKFGLSFVPKAHNGRPALRSRDSAGQCLQFILPDIQAYEGLTLVYVCANTGARTGGETIIGIEKPVKWVFGDYGNQLGRVSDQPLGQGYSFEPNRPNLVSYRFSRDSGWDVCLNCNQAGQRPNLAFPNGPAGVVIGSFKPNDPNAQPFGGDIYEILIFDRPLATDEHREVCNYLSLKYGLMLPPPSL